MIKLNSNMIYRLKAMGHHYYITVANGIFLTFDSDTLEYTGINTIYNVSDKTLVEKETEGLNKLYKMGWII